MIKKLGFLIAGLTNKLGKFDRRSIIGFVLLLTPYIIGAVTHQSTSITNVLQKRYPTCDSFIHGFCIPTTYVPIPLAGIGYLVLNLTSFLLSASRFLIGFFLVKKRS
ncbi:MAG: hypothetical protein ACREBB_02255 [Nitrosotalea sp.]